MADSDNCRNLYHPHACDHTSTLTAQAAIQPVKMRRMARPPMIKKTYLVPPKLYEAAMAKAEEREESLSDVIRAALERYVEDQ